jgi:pyruvate ferredoxin oxidoreductase alpha subunit
MTDKEFKRMMEGNEAAAWGAKLARVEVVPVYPITPQTELISHMASLIANGLMKTEYIKVEGEHTAMAAAVGASAVGARVFTASSSQGVAFMDEPLWIPPGRRLPIVMCFVNRTMAPLGGLRPDHNDSLHQRDKGWILLYCENSQEVLDTIIQAYKIAENPEVYLPVGVCYDGYFVSATATPTTVPDQAKVDEWLPPYKHEWYSLMPEEHKMPNERAHFLLRRLRVAEAHEKAKQVIKDVDADFEKVFGRGYSGLIEEYNCEGAEAALITIGSMTGTARDVVDEMRSEGKKIGLIKLKCFRPFPSEEFQAISHKYKAMGVVDRNNSFGSAGGGIVNIELSRALYNEKEKPLLVNFLVGLSGTDVTMNQLVYMAEETLKVARTGKVKHAVDWVETHDLGEVM